MWASIAKAISNDIVFPRTVIYQFLLTIEHTRTDSDTVLGFVLINFRATMKQHHVAITTTPTMCSDLE
jgi:hypothetical protein